MIIAVNFSIKAPGKKKPEKNQGFNGIRTLDLCVTDALLYQLSYEATQKFKFGKFTAMIILHSHLQPQFKNELFHILHISIIFIYTTYNNSEIGSIVWTNQIRTKLASYFCVFLKWKEP